MIAQTLLNAFYTKTVDDTAKVCIHTDHEHAETVKAMVFAADQSGLGWDFAYEAVRNALQYLADLDTTPADNDESHEFADGAVDVYNADRIKWLASSPINHMQLCDEAAEELGYEGKGIAELIGIGQYHAYTLAYSAVAENWPTEEDDETEDEA